MNKEREALDWFYKKLNKLDKNPDNDENAIVIDKALTKLERIEVKLSQIDVEEVQERFDRLDANAENGISYDVNDYYTIQNIIDTLRGVKDE